MPHHGTMDSTISKVKDLAELLLERERLRTEGRKVVLTNGCFDLLHLGHIDLLEKARALGDVLIVAINSDRSTRELKGPDRPVIPQEERAEVLAALRAVDFVTVFDELTPRSLIAQLLPDVLAKGGDWSDEAIVGRAEVEASGGRVVRIPYLEGHSTTELVKRIREAASKRTY